MSAATAGAPPIEERLGDPPRPVLVWPLSPPRLGISSAPLGGGIGERAWVVNVGVENDYSRTDLEEHLHDVAAAAGLRGSGVGFLTAADVSAWTAGHDGGVSAYATVGLERPTWAAAHDDPPDAPAPGTINAVTFLPVRLSDTALVNAIATVAEAKAQALFELGIPGTGTASDAACVLVPAGGPHAIFGGPRSDWGARLARAVHEAVRAGAAAWLERRGAAG